MQLTITWCCFKLRNLQMCHLCARCMKGKRNAPAGSVPHLKLSCGSILVTFFFFFFSRHHCFTQWRTIDASENVNRVQVSVKGVRSRDESPHYDTEHLVWSSHQLKANQCRWNPAAVKCFHERPPLRDWINEGHTCKTLPIWKPLKCNKTLCLKLQISWIHLDLYRHENSWVRAL